MKQSEQKKDTGQKKFEIFFEFATMGIVLVNGNGEIDAINPFALKQFGYNDEKELAGKKVESLIPSRFHHSHVDNRDKYTAHPKSRPMGVGLDLFAVKKDGREFPVEVSLGSYTINDSKHIIVFITDISVRKKTEAQIEKLNNDLEATVEQRTKELTVALNELKQSRDELSKLFEKEKELGDLKSRFVSMASHEFRTPLSTILSSASLVARYTETSQQGNREKHIQRIKSSVNNLTDLLNEFLSIGKIEDGKIKSYFSEFNIKELLETICNEMQNLTKKRQKIIYNHIGSETVNLDPALLRNTILNLLSNAIKFSPEDSTVLLSSTVIENKVIIIVKDNGIGISKEDQQHLFERFFRGTNAVNIQGTGLGLHIVSKYIELMNGQVSLTSELEEGTEIIITFIEP